MKKNILGVSALILAVCSGTAIAADNGGEVQFSGVVSDTTCNIVPSVGGAEGAVVQLGTVATSETGESVAFSLRPAAGSQCGDASLTGAVFNFVSSSMNSVGVGNSSGTATDANMTLQAVNAIGGPVDIKQGSTTAEVAMNDLNDPAKGAQFEVQLIGGAVPGNYLSSVTYSVYYN